MKKNIFIILVFIFAGTILLQAQKDHYVVDDVYIDAGGFIYISTGDTVRLEGNIVTARDNTEAQRGMISFNGAAGWSTTHSAFVDGYVRSQKPGAFIFPIGQGSYHPAAISKAAANDPTDAAYYSAALYGISTSDLEHELIDVTNESWVIQGTTPATITLSWSSDLSAFAKDVKQLGVAGWDAKIHKWVLLPSAHEATSSIFGTVSTLTQGTVSTTSEIVPNQYAAYTLGFTKPLYTLNGTVFPFVHKTLSDGSRDDAFNKLYKVTAKLYSVPHTLSNPLLALLRTNPLHETVAVYYDGSIYVPTTPLNPGKVGLVNNPGFPINWAHLGYHQRKSESATVTPENNLPDPPVGIYAFHNVDEGDYILTLSAPGFVTRYAKISVSDDLALGHRELIAGDFNNDGIIDQRDAAIGNAMRSSYPEYSYMIKYDVNSDKEVNQEDVMLVTDDYFGFFLLLYEETGLWLNKQ